MDGLKLTFHLAGINNQNFLMRDEETGTYWQQISGNAISGRLAGRQLPLIAADELTFAMWKAEEPRGQVLRDVPKYVSEYASKDWDVQMKRMPAVLSFARPGLAARDLMLGIRAFGGSRAFPFDTVVRQKLIRDHVGSEPVLLVVGPDGRSVRAFRDRIAGVDGAPDFYSVGESLMDTETGSRWNFRGCAVDGRAKGQCLEHVEVIKDYWFDWRNYNPDTTVYGMGAARRKGSDKP